ncbi:MAG: C10 family peptidase [Candidatus Zixiibacteriota bacterium]
MKRVIICVLTILLAIFSIFGKPISQLDASIVAEKHIDVFAHEMTDEFNNIQIDRFRPILEDDEILAHIAHLEPKGFIAISTDTRIDPVIAYSFDNNFNMEETPQNIALSMIKQDIKFRQSSFERTSQTELDENRNLWVRYLSKDDRLSEYFSDMEIYGPSISTNWGQGSPYNAYAPLDPMTGRRSVTGCVATAITMCLNYYQWPPSIKFYDYDNYTSEYTDPPIYVEAEPASIDSIDWREAETRPSWDNVARVMFAAGVSTDMNYSSRASGTWVYSWHFLTDFGFGRADDISPEYDGFYDHLASSIIADKPAMMSVYGDDGGHQINCDGYNSSTGRFHLNMGWEGSGNGWYSLPDGMPAGFYVVNGAIVNITKPRYQRIRVPSIELATIEEAIEEAWPGDTIIISDGRYSLSGFKNIDFGALRIFLKSQNGPLACTLDCAASRDEPAQAFIFQWGESRDAVLDGFTITNAYTDTMGAIQIYKSSPTIRNCIFTNNSTNGQGGAIYAYHAYPRFENCIFQNNSARNGGAFMLRKSDAEIINCNIMDNTASFGGSIYLQNSSDAKILNCILWGNFAESYGNEIFINNIRGGDVSWPHIGNSIIDIFGNFIEDDAGELVFDTGNLSIDPDLLDTPNPFSPSMESYCINTGSQFLADTDIKAPDSDIYGNPRPAGTGLHGIGYDIGAVETGFDNDNRPPVIHGIPEIAYIRAGEELQIPFSISDPDGDDVEAHIETSTDAEIHTGPELVWDTERADTGEYEILVSASDGIYSPEKICSVYVVDGYCGNISGIWNSEGGPHYINCDVYIESGTSLTIEPGTEIVFNGPFALNVELGATLSAIGTDESPIRFSKAEDAEGHHGIRFFGASDDCRFEYCEITGGNANGIQPRNRGGAIYSVETNLAIENCIIDENRSDASGGAIFALNSNIILNENIIIRNYSIGDGGGLHLVDSDPVITDNEFFQNQAACGGGIYYHGGYGSIEGNLFEENIALEDGGGFYSSSNVSRNEHNIFRENSALNGAGMFISDCNGWLKNCDFFYNEASEDGGGLYFNSCPTDMEIHGHWLLGNSALNGAGIIFDSGLEPLIITSSLISYNISEGYGGGVYSTLGSIPVLVNCTLNENQASEGGGISIAGSSNITLFNTLVWNNHALSSSGHEIEIEAGMAFLTYTDVMRSRCNMGGGIIDFGEGCIEADPLFEDTLGHLGMGSPCINTGDQFFTIMESDEIIMAPFRDHDEARRPLEGKWDIGADESEYSSVEEPVNSTPEVLKLHTYPNPFNSSVSIELPENTKEIAIYDLNGIKIFTSDAENISIIKWQPEAKIESGIYLVEASVAGQKLASRVIFVK